MRPATAGNLAPAGIRVAAPQTRVWLLDESTLTRECLAQSLRQHAAGLAVEGAATPPPEAAPPDMLLLNIHAARTDDAAVAARIAGLVRRYPETPLLVIADRDEGRLVRAAIGCGARGYLPATLNTRLLAAAIGLVLAGGIFIPPPAIGDAAHPAPAAPPPEALTPREADVLALLRQGKPNKIIAYELAISESTVKVHVHSILRKLRATNRTQLAVWSAGIAARPAGFANGSAPR